MIIISSDSTCDLGELVQKHGIEIMPLKVILDADSYYDGVDITPSDIFEFVEKKKMLPKTSAASEMEFTEYFEKLLQKGDEVIHFNISSKASVTHNCAKAAAQNFNGKVKVIDSLALSSGQGLLVMKAVDLKNQGKTAEEIETEVNALREKVNTSFIPDRLDYLYKGGRCSKMEMYGANLLRIHPMIDMKDGALTVKRKFRGKMEMCMKAYVEDLKNTYPAYDKTRCFITHASAYEGLVEYTKNLVKESFDFDEVIETVAGAVVTGHCGKNTIGVLFIAE